MGYSRERERGQKAYTERMEQYRTHRHIHMHKGTHAIRHVEENNGKGV